MEYRVVSENENPKKEANESENKESRSSDRRSGGRGGDDRRSGGRGGRGGSSSGGRGRRRRGKTYYCPKGKCFDYKNLDTLSRFVSEGGKIKPRRQTGNCSRCQRELAREVKRARHLALLPFADAN